MSAHQPGPPGVPRRGGSAPRGPHTRQRPRLCVRPSPVGPIIRMFFGEICTVAHAGPSEVSTRARWTGAASRTSSLSGEATRCLRQRLRIATATARLASGCPTMYLSSCSTISFGRSAFSRATSADSPSSVAEELSSMVTFTEGCAAALAHVRTRWRLARCGVASARPAKALLASSMAPGGSATFPAAPEATSSLRDGGVGT